MTKNPLDHGIGALELVEEAVQLLRGAPVGLYAAYAVGTLPCVLGFLYFWADMSRGAFAREHAAIGAVGMGLLFWWMKCCQAVFADGLYARVAGQNPARWTLRRAARMAQTQIALQPTGLFVLPVALALLLPGAWVYGFYQNLTVAPDKARGLADTCRAAAAQAGYRSRQNHLLLGILFLFAFFVWVNVVTTLAFLPSLLKTLLGIDTAFTQAGVHSILNSTYFACSFALSYIFVDPLIKAAYVLRWFYGQSLHSAEDLKAELSRLRAASTGILALLAVMLLVAVPARAQVAPPPTPPTSTAPRSVVSAAELDQSIARVLARREFAWRMPREKPDVSTDAPKSWLGRMLQSFLDDIARIMKAIGHGLHDALKWLGKQLEKLWPGSVNGGVPRSGLGWTSTLQIVLLLAIVGLAGFLGVLIYRAWRRRRRGEIITATTVPAAPNLNDENVAADQLPEDGWLKMAREMMDQGNLRLALRALYLASLSHLAARELIGIAVFKSNREYETELHRRTRALPEVQSAFSQNVAAFDRVWYGLHEVTLDALQQFESNLARIRAC